MHKSEQSLQCKCQQYRLLGSYVLFLSSHYIDTSDQPYLRLLSLNPTTILVVLLLRLLLGCFNMCKSKVIFLQSYVKQGQDITCLWHICLQIFEKMFSIQNLKTLLAILNTLFTIHSESPALKFYCDPFLAASTLDYIAKQL